MSCEFVFFDLGNVITFFDHDKAVQSLAPDCEVSIAELRQLLHDSQLKTDYEKGRISSEACHQQFCEFAKSSIGLDDFLFRLSDIFTLNASLVPLLTSLRFTGVPMGILSNTCEAHWNYLADRLTILNDFFRIKVLSFEVNALKPEAEIYLQAAQMAAMDPDKLFFTDDRPEHVQGARDAGWQAEPFVRVAKLNRDLIANGIATNY